MEDARLNALLRYQILDTPPEEAFDALVDLASSLCHTPVALISLVDSERQWFKANKGLPVSETPRCIAFCDHAIRSTDVFIVEDASKDERFKENPLVANIHGIRSYAGAPLKTPEGHLVGSLCVIDFKPRKFLAVQIEQLAALARQVVAQMELRLKTSELETLIRDYQFASQEKEEQALRFEAALDAMYEGLVVQTRSGVITHANARAAEILGLSMDQLLGRKSVDPNWHCIRDDGSDFDPNQHPAMVSLSEGISQTDVPMGVYHSDGNLAWIKINSRPVFVEGDPKPVCVITTFSDVSQERQRTAQIDQYLVMISNNTVELEYQRQELEKANASLEELAFRDGLTGLYNHRSFQSTLQQYVEANQAVGLLMIDVDHFKRYNDTYGHPEGDRVLQAFATILNDSVRPQDTVYRYGGEEFAVILSGANDRVIFAVANRIIERLHTYPWPKLSVTASLGAACRRRDGVDRKELIALADAALYAAKHGGRDQVIVSGPEELRPTG